MFLMRHYALMGLLVMLLKATRSEPNNNSISTSYYPPDGSNKSNGLTSIFSPRMDFNQWKPLTGRGDPLHNDPTYDYEPPVLEKVHYWAEENRPERKSEVLMLGVSSRKPSVAPRPPVPPRRIPRPPSFSQKYEDFTYKLGEHYPITILVPPPLPLPGHKPSLFIMPVEKNPVTTSSFKFPEQTQVTRDTTPTPEILTSFALQEANLIYQSTTRQNWIQDYNKTTNYLNNAVSSDYAGWGPTTPIEDINDAHNIIPHADLHNVELKKQTLSYYKPVLSEAPPPPQATPSYLTLPTFLPTVLPPSLSTINSQVTSDEITQEVGTETTNYFIGTSTEKNILQSYDSTSTPQPNIDMLGPMMSMPMVTDPDRPEDQLYAHASDNVQIFKEPLNTGEVNIEIMQTMQPPPPTMFLDSTTQAPKKPFHVNAHVLNNWLHEKPTHTHDPYLHMRFTTPTTTTANPSHDLKSTTEASPIPTYLIIQGHSKVKTYGSKPKPISGNIRNEIPNPNETTEVKHLHPIKDKYTKKIEKHESTRVSRAQNLKTLVDNGLGSIEIQETDLGIKYDVSDGSNVPIEIYRKGIVDSDENDYTGKNKNIQGNIRAKKQIDLEKLLPFDEDSLEEFVYDLLKKKTNETSFTGLLAQSITSDKALSDVDDIEDNNDDENGDDNEER